MAIKPRNVLLAGCTAILVAACGGATQDQAALQEREAELQQREAELAAREEALTAQNAPEQTAAVEPAPVAPPVAAAPQPAPKPAPKPAATPRPAASTPAATVPQPAPAPRVVTVPAGTQLEMALSSDLTTKTAKVGDRVTARLSKDVVVDGRVALAQGTVVAGEVIGVVSGSRKVGGVPSLGLQFKQLELAGGGSLPINGEVTQTGRSDTARDTAKIAGGAAAGAIIGNQIGHGDGNKVIGGILGGAIGAVAAHRTGTEVELPAGTPIAIALTSGVEVTL